MRQVLTHLALGLAGVLPLLGCNHTPIIRDRAPAPPVTDKQPDTASLVNYLNQNAAQAEENAGALGWQLDDGDLAVLDDAALPGIRTMANRVWQHG